MSINQRKTPGGDDETEVPIDKNEGIKERVDDVHDDMIDDEDIVECNDDSHNLESIEDNENEEIDSSSNDDSNSDGTCYRTGDDDDDDSSEEIFRDDNQLQQAICKGKSIRTILKIINLDPMGVYYKNKLGDYPLHVALFCGNNYIAMKLVELFPEVTQHQNENGQYPLQLACRDHQLYDSAYYSGEDYHINENIFDDDDDDSSNEISRDVVMDYTLDDVVMKLIEIFPEAAIASSKCDGTALYFACDNKNLSETVIMKLIELNPLAIQEKCREDRYPIHSAILQCQPITVIKNLLNGDPLGMLRRSGFREESPLHVVCMRNNYELVQYFMQRSDLSINIRDKCGGTPLHNACRCSDDGKIVEMLLHHPDIDVNATDYWNQTPLHRTLELCITPERCITVIQKLLDHPFILITNQKNNRCITPLYLIKARADYSSVYYCAVQEEAKMKCFKKLIHLFDEYPVKKRWQVYCDLVKNFMKF